MADGGGNDGAQVIRSRRARPGNDDLKFAKVPNEIILEVRLSPQALRLLAYRLTKVGNFVLHRTDVKKQLGMSKSAFYKALQELIAAGLIERTENHRAPRNKRVTEKLLVRVPGPDDSGYTWVWLKLIRDLPPAALAVYMLLLAHWPKRKLYAREVRDHFGWSQPTVQGWMTYLIFHGLAGELPRRNNGDFAGSVYVPAELSADEIARWSKRDGKPTRPRAKEKSAEPRNPETTRKQSSGAPNLAEPSFAEGDSENNYRGPTFLTEELAPSTQPPLPDPRPLRGSRRGERGAGGGEPLPEDGGVEDWLDELHATRPKKWELWGEAMGNEDELEECHDKLGDETLRLALWQATDARVGHRLLSERGLDGYRRIVMGCANIADVSIESAHRYLIGLIADHFGSDVDHSLNSWRWLAWTSLRWVNEPGDIPAHEVDDDDNDYDEIPF